METGRKGDRKIWGRGQRYIRTGPLVDRKIWGLKDTETGYFSFGQRNGRHRLRPYNFSFSSITFDCV